MEILIMKALFVLMGVLPIAKKMMIFKKKVRFNFQESQTSEEDMKLLKEVLKGEKK